jgi:hypothetical protein
MFKEPTVAYTDYNENLDYTFQNPDFRSRISWETGALSLEGILNQWEEMISVFVHLYIQDEGWYLDYWSYFPKEELPFFQLITELAKKENKEQEWEELLSIENVLDYEVTELLESYDFTDQVEPDVGQLIANTSEETCNQLLYYMIEVQWQDALADAFEEKEGKLRNDLIQKIEKFLDWLPTIEEDLEAEELDDLFPYYYRYANRYHHEKTTEGLGFDDWIMDFEEVFSDFPNIELFPEDEINAIDCYYEYANLSFDELIKRFNVQPLVNLLIAKKRREKLRTKGG